MDNDRSYNVHHSGMQQKLISACSNRLDRRGHTRSFSRVSSGCCSVINERDEKCILDLFSVYVSDVRGALYFRA